MKKRGSRERRQFGKTAGFPLTDSNGCVVMFNRSRQPERRMNNYVLQDASNEDYLVACINTVLGQQ
jgi:hypothetical protein